MFTGIIRAVGELVDRSDSTDGTNLKIDAKLDYPWQLGSSIAVNGVCLSISKIENNQLSFDISQETLAKTTLGKLQPKQRINIEPALKVGDELGGHWVSGHIDQTSQLLDIKGETFIFAIKPDLQKFLAVKGSIAIDGVSLTIASVTQDGFSVAIIPWTLKHSIFCDYKKGDHVNLEVDMMSRYLMRHLSQAS